MKKEYLAGILAIILALPLGILMGMAYVWRAIYLMATGGKNEEATK